MAGVLPAELSYKPDMIAMDGLRAPFRERAPEIARVFRGPCWTASTPLPRSASRYRASSHHASEPRSPTKAIIAAIASAGSDQK